MALNSEDEITNDTWIKTGSVTLSQTSPPASPLYRQPIHSEWES